MSESTKIQLKNVRLSFPSLFQRAQFNGEDGKYEATFLFSKKDKKLKDKLDKAIAAKLKEANINSFGKRINANLYGVQFVKDGEAFGMGPVDVTDDFDDLSDDEDDDLDD